MAEAVVSFVVERLHNLVVEEAKFLHGLSGEVNQIQIELKRMQCFLKDADAKRDDNERISNWVAEIREIAYETEDVIETFVLRVAFKRRGGAIQCILRQPACILNQGTARHKVGLEIKAIKTKICELTRSLQTYGIRSIIEGEGSSNSASERQLQFRRSYSHVVEEDFIGLEADVEKLAAVLVNDDEENSYRVVSICGMGGLGKTTIAQKIYSHRKVKHHFDAVAWVCISQQWQTRHVLDRILIKLIPHEREEILKMGEEELVGLLYQVQLKKKCLVVLDDIWSMDAWDCLKHAFPIGKMGTKLLLTTRNQEVALHVDPNGFLHEPRFLNEDESWELFQKKAFGKTASIDTRNDKKLEDLGRKMVLHCGGLPLAVAVLGGILVTKHKLRDWEMVHQNISSYIRMGKCMGQQRGGVSQVLALSYSDLPYHLKPCFLYIGGFPEDFELETEKLYQLWMAEGMISSDYKAEGEAMMDVAERCLGELARRYMVQVQVDELTGRFEYCRLHDLMRDLCLVKAKEENFLKVVDFRHEKELPDSSSSSSIGSIRRLAIDLGEDQDKFVFPKEITAGHLRSVLVFVPNPYICVPMPWMLKSHLNDFKLLRVLDLDRIQYSKKLAKSVGKLIHLRYLGLKNSGFRKLPSSICNLGCLQTLDLRLHQQMYVRRTRIPNVIWQLKNLRHLYLHDNIGNTKEKLRLDGLNMLEILETFYTSLFDVKDLFKLTNLWKLKASIKPTLEDLVSIINYLSITANQLRYSSFHIDYSNFCSEEELTLLRQLVECGGLSTLHIRGVLAKLPEQHHFSPSLTTLEFSISELKEDPMTTLEKLPNLRSLTLGPRAFVGMEMVCSATGFGELKFLQLHKLPYLERWTMDEGAMPKLFSLEINGCMKLSEIPDGFRFLTTLQELKITNMGEIFQKRLQVKDGNEGDDFHKVRHVPSITFSPIYYDPIPISALPEILRRHFYTE